MSPFQCPDLQGAEGALLVPSKRPWWFITAYRPDSVILFLSRDRLAVLSDIRGTDAAEPQCAVVLRVCYKIIEIEFTEQTFLFESTGT